MNSLIALPGTIPGKKLILQTRLGNDIENWQPSALSAYILNQAATYPKNYPQIKVRSNADPAFNCHGLTFASRRTWIESSSELRRILDEDGYKLIPIDQVMSGDVILYIANDGDLEHSGVVVSPPADLGVPTILSKWGGFGEVIHLANYGPYRGNWQFYRIK